MYMGQIAVFRSPCFPEEDEEDNQLWAFGLWPLKHRQDQSFTVIL